MSGQQGFRCIACLKPVITCICYHAFKLHTNNTSRYTKYSHIAISQTKESVTGTVPVVSPEGKCLAWMSICVSAMPNADW